MWRISSCFEYHRCCSCTACLEYCHLHVPPTCLCFHGSRGARINRHTARFHTLFMTAHAYSWLHGQSRCESGQNIGGQRSLMPNAGLGGKPAPDYCIEVCEQWASPLYCDSDHPQDIPLSNLSVSINGIIPTAASAGKVLLGAL